MDYKRKIKLGFKLMAPVYAAEMSFEAGEFDVAMVSFGLHEMDRALIVRVLREMARVVKDGGELYIVDYAREGAFLKRAAFTAFLWIVEPKHMPEFLRYDWEVLLAHGGWRLDVTEVYFCSKLMSASKATEKGLR